MIARLTFLHPRRFAPGQAVAWPLRRVQTPGDDERWGAKPRIMRGLEAAFCAAALALLFAWSVALIAIA